MNVPDPDITPAHMLAVWAARLTVSGAQLGARMVVVDSTTVVVLHAGGADRCHVVSGIHWRLADHIRHATTAHN